MSKHKKVKGKSVVMDLKSIRLKTFKRLCVILLPVTIYVSYALSGLYKMDVSIDNLKPSMLWCLLHPMEAYGEKTLPCMMIGLIIWTIASISIYNKINNNLMHGREYGDAKWGDIDAFNKKYAMSDEDIMEEKKKDLPSNISESHKNRVVKEHMKKADNIHPENKVLSENVRFRYKSDTLRNNNIFVVGGSGAGKTSFFLTPNLLSLHDCNIYTDPKGGLVEDFGGWLSNQKDTRVYVVDMCNMEKSMRFNPFLYIKKRSDISKLITNLMQNTESNTTKNASSDPFWPKAEKMFLESIMTYVWMECPKADYNEKTGKAVLLERNWRTVLKLLDEAQFGDGDVPPKLDGRMNRLAKAKPDHPAAKAYNRYRSGPEDTARSVIMTVNARMQPFDNEELLDVFCGNDIPLDEFGVGKDGDGKTKSNLFIVIPDDDDTYNFVPGILYTILFQEMYRQARYFGGKLPMDVGVFMDEFANIKTPSNFDKILATCRSRGIYCVEILQSLAQIKTLFADGAWEGIIGNNDTFIYLGGNEASTFEYISKLLGKWTIDKKTNGESKGSNGSYSENYDVLGRELMLEYEIRLLPDDECIIFVRGENPIRDKKWFPWEHEIYRIAKSGGPLEYDISEMEEVVAEKDRITFVSEGTLDYMKKQAKQNDSIKIYGMNVLDFMKLDLDAIKDLQSNTDVDSIEDGLMDEDETIDATRLQELYEKQIARKQEEDWEEYVNAFDRMSLLDVFSSGMLSKIRQETVKILSKKGASDGEIKNVIRPENTEDMVVKKRDAWLEMKG